MSGVCKAAAEVCKLEQVKNLFEGKLVEGVVTAKNQSFMLVDIGFKSDVKVGCMGVWDYYKYDVGQPIEVCVERLESEAGEVMTSRSELSEDEAWAAAASAQAQRSWVRGEVMAKVQEGHAVQVFGITALLPFELTDRRFWYELATCSEVEVRVFEVNREANTLTLSKQVEGDANEDASPSRKLTASDQLWCVVNTVDEEGVHVDMGWRNGLVRLDHMAWFSIVELLNALFAGCAISAMFYAEDLEGDEATLVVEWPEGDKLPKPRKWWLESEGGGERAAEEAEELDDDEEGGGGARQQLEGEREDEVEGEREDEVEGEREDEVEGAKEGCGDDGASRSWTNIRKLEGESEERELQALKQPAAGGGQPAEQNKKRKAWSWEGRGWGLGSRQLTGDSGAPPHQSEAQPHKEPVAYGVVEDVSAEALVIRASPALALLVVAEDFDVNDVEAALAEEFVFRGDVVKMLPLAISYTYGSVEIDLDVDGARYLKFVKLCWGRVMKATVLEADNGVVAVKLADGIYGKLVVGDDAAAIDEATELGKQAGDVIDVVMCDFNPETNTIYLMAVDDEQASLRLTEA